MQGQGEVVVCAFLVKGAVGTGAGKHQQRVCFLTKITHTAACWQQQQLLLHDRALLTLVRQHRWHAWLRRWRRSDKGQSVRRVHACVHVASAAWCPMMVSVMLSSTNYLLTWRVLGARQLPAARSRVGRTGR